jgi:hypothetical protein
MFQINVEFHTDSEISATQKRRSVACAMKGINTRQGNDQFTILSSFLFVFFFYSNQNMRATSVLLSLACAASMVMAAPVVPSSKEPVNASSDQVHIYTQCNRPGVFALTFDDGPEKYSWGLAKSLQEQGIKATFFINGENSV